MTDNGKETTALSPFLPGTYIQFAWDSTSLGWLKTCPRLYFYSMIEGWRSRGKSVHLDFGSAYHAALELYDRQRAVGDDHNTAVFEAVKYCLEVTWVYPSTEGLDLDTPSGMSAANQPGVPMDWGHNLKSRETLCRSVIWYLEEFGENDAAKTVVLANGKPAVELSFKLEMDFGPQGYKQSNKDGFSVEWNHNRMTGELVQPYVICGHLDRLVQFGDGIYVMDRKTSSTTIGSYYFDGYNPDNQMSLYTFASKVIYQTPVRGVIIDAAQIAVGFTRFSRGFTFRTESQTEEWLTETRSWLALAEHYATRGEWPMNDKSCHHFGGCAFRKVCSKAPEVRQRFLETDFEKRVWNPLEPR
jgi:hypothetical protein